MQKESYVYEQLLQIKSKIQKNSFLSPQYSQRQLFSTQQNFFTEKQNLSFSNIKTNDPLMKKLNSSKKKQIMTKRSNKSQDFKLKQNEKLMIKTTPRRKKADFSKLEQQWIDDKLFNNTSEQTKKNLTEKISKKSKSISSSNLNVETTNFNQILQSFLMDEEQKKLDQKQRDQQEINEYLKQSDKIYDELHIQMEESKPFEYLNIQTDQEKQKQKLYQKIQENLSKQVIPNKKKYFYLQDDDVKDVKQIVKEKLKINKSQMLFRQLLEKNDQNVQKKLLKMNQIHTEKLTKSQSQKKELKKQQSINHLQLCKSQSFMPTPMSILSNLKSPSNYLQTNNKIQSDSNQIDNIKKNDVINQQNKDSTQIQNLNKNQSMINLSKQETPNSQNKLGITTMSIKKCSINIQDLVTDKKMTYDQIIKLQQKFLKKQEFDKQLNIQYKDDEITNAKISENNLPIKKTLINLVSKNYYETMNDLLNNYAQTTKNHKQKEKCFIAQSQQDKYDTYLNMNSFQIQNLLGKGSYAQVNKVIMRKTNEIYAMKSYDKYRLIDKNKQNNVKREIQILRKLNHPNIIKLFYAFETDTQIQLILEYDDSNIPLKQYMNQQIGRQFSESQARNIFYQIVKGINYCHQNNVYHRDIKIDNLLINNQEQIKIIDFGFSVIQEQNKKLTLLCGTPSYMSPEICSKKSYYGHYSDIWALGVLLYLLLTNKYPFTGMNDEELFRKINKGKIYIPEFVSPLASSLITKILQVDPEQRIQITQILKDPWFQ